MTINIKIFITTLVLSFIFIVSISMAEQDITPCTKNQIISHSGGTDKCGCHYNRKTGTYHCHNRKQRGGDCPS